MGNAVADAARGGLKSKVVVLGQRATSKGTPIALAAVLVIALLFVLAGERALAWRAAEAEMESAREVKKAASAEVEALIRVSGSSRGDGVDRLLAGATSDFRSELEAQADELSKALIENDVTATGDVVSAGVVQLKDDRATVIVAATGSVKNKQTAKAEPRNYRLRVELQQVDDRWLVSGLEFVA